MSIIERVKNFIFFDLRWMVFHITISPFLDLKNALVSAKNAVVAQERPKELMRLFLIMFVVFSFTKRKDIMLLGLGGFLVSYVAHVYYSKVYIHTMRKYTQKIDWKKNLKEPPL